VPFVTRFAARPVLTFAAVSALALMLAACGLKGPLDPPPAATPAPGAQLEGQPGAPPPEGETPPQSPRKRIFLDWLLD
jgi:predicted small lipoprotein YifL